MDNVILIGMPGSGKSTTGVILAKTLGYSFIDTDLVIQKRTSRLLQDLVDTEGIDSFIKHEEESILSLSVDSSVIATGGSAVYSERAMEYLRKSGIVIYLDADINTLCTRLENINTRGIAMDKGQTIEGLKNERDPLYRKYSDLTVSTADKTLEETVTDIVKKIDGLRKTD